MGRGFMKMELLECYLKQKQLNNITDSLSSLSLVCNAQLR